MYGIDPFYGGSGQSTFRFPGGQSEPYGSSPSTFSPYPDPVADSMIDAVVKPRKSALQLLGETVGKPFRALRGVTTAALTGDPSHLREGLSILPFSDALGITNPEETVGGRELLEKAGVLGPNTPGLDWGDAAGFALDLGTDPLTYVGLGPLTKLGKVAEGAAKLTPGLSAGIRAGERSLLDVGLPFGGWAARKTGIEGLGARLPIGTGERSAKILESTWDPAFDAVRYSKPGREVARLFKPELGNQSTQLGQELYPER